MTHLTFDEVALGARLARIPSQGQLAFAVSCAERLLPNYRAFSRSEGWGDPEALAAGLSSAWGILRTHDKTNPGAITALTKRVEAAEPETEDFDSPYVSPALDAAAVVGSVLQLMGEATWEKAVEAATFARDTVDMYVQEILNLDASEPDLEERIRLHPLMQRELRRQSEDLKTIEEWVNGVITFDDLENRLRHQSSNIDLSAA